VNHHLYRPALTRNHITISLSETTACLFPGEMVMVISDKKRQTFIIDLEKLNTLNAEGCVSCGRKFTLGETVVNACGAWEGPPKIVHENEAVWDVKTASFIERGCYESRKEG